MVLRSLRVASFVHLTAASRSRRRRRRACAVQGYKMRDETLAYACTNPDLDGGIYTAVRIWVSDLVQYGPTVAKAKYGPIASWDTSAVTNMTGMFCGTADFNEDISRWDVSNVVEMGYMFNSCTSFNGDLSSWNVSSVKSMAAMFQGATSFNGDLSRWQIGQVKSMNFMFDGATSFNGDLSTWQVGQVKSMLMMFRRATSFTHQLSGAWSTSTASQGDMFGGGCPGSIA